MGEPTEELTSAGAAAPLIETKLHAPRRRRGLVDRERLDRRIGGVGLPSVVLVSAPAGFGKTTVLAEWARRAEARGLRTAWLSLDGRDRDPAVFWSYVIAALCRHAPGLGADALATLRSTPTALERVARALVNDLAELDVEVALVLDDYHVIDSIELHESVLFLVEHLPARIHLLVGSRSDPPWPLARLRTRGDLVEIRAADLRFRSDEITSYLNTEMELGLGAGDIEALGARTEGWIAALQLAALSMQGHDDASGFIANFTGDDRFVVDYLIDEVLDRQPDEIRSFLLDTSLLGRLSASLCAAVTGRTDAKDVLARLDRSNLFLVALDDRREWYRYHHLFADVLQARLSDGPGDHVVELHRRAGDWWDAHGDRAEAIRHFLDAGAVERAAELIELSVPELREHRQDSTLRSWMEALPEAVFADRPVLNLGRVGSHMVMSDTVGVAGMLDQIEASLEPDATAVIVHDRAELRRVPAQAAMYRAALSLLSGDLAGTEEHATRAAALTSPEDRFGLGAATALSGLACWAAGDLRAAADRYEQAVDHFVAAGQVPSALGCMLSLADLQVGLGQLDLAAATLRSGVELSAAHGPQRGSADMHVGLAEIHLERDQLAEAAEQLRLGLELGERFALAQFAHRWRVVDARLRAGAGDIDGALDLLLVAERHYDTDYSPAIRPVAATIAQVQLAAGDLAAVERWAAGARLDPGDEPAYVREYEHLTFARFLIASGRGDDAVALLERLEGAAERGGRAGSLAEARELRALASNASRPAHDGRASQPPVEPLVDPLSKREMDVLRLLRSELTGPEIAAELIVSLNTVRTHTKSIFTKLGVSNRRAAVRRADELGL